MANSSEHCRTRGSVKVSYDYLAACSVITYDNMKTIYFHNTIIRRSFCIAISIGSQRMGHRSEPSAIENTKGVWGKIPQATQH